MSKFEVIAKDFNSPFFRNYIWTACWDKFAELWDVPRLLLFTVAEKESLKYVGDLQSWTVVHQIFRERVSQDPQYLDGIVTQTMAFGEKFNRWSEKYLVRPDLRHLSGEELTARYQEFAEKQATLYAYGVVMPTMDFLSFSFVEEGLKKYQGQPFTEREFADFFRVFTYPCRPSFAEEQETDLLRLLAKYENDGKWRTMVLEKTAQEIKESFPTFWKRLEKHTEKYDWVYFVYRGPKYKAEDFLGFLREYIRQGTKAKEKLEANRQERRDIEKKQRQYLKQLHPTAAEKAFLRFAGRLVWSKPRRKDLQSRSYSHLENLHKELARRLCLTLNQVRSLPLDQVGPALRTGQVDTDYLNAIYDFHVCLPEKEGIRILAGAAGREYFQKEITAEQGNRNTVRILSGNCAQVGTVKGRVRIINRPEEMEKMQDGDVLVSVATTPSLVPAIRRAGAIVTDEGGLTCHASIVSREFKIPCVVGTKIATQVLQDGQMVKVDADKGIVEVVE
ncbi:MAG TPA: PEP-utilizing enzyme [Patescibacteria group bacterium]|nr:PEP-utilizing enzyme [Patescibacteria group bacterium]